MVFHYFRTDLIDNFMIVNKLTEFEFCEKCNVSFESFSQIYNQDGDADILILSKMAKLMGLKYYELLVLKEFKPQKFE